MLCHIIRHGDIKSLCVFLEWASGHTTSLTVSRQTLAQSSHAAAKNTARLHSSSGMQDKKKGPSSREQFGNNLRARCTPDLGSTGTTSELPRSWRISMPGVCARYFGHSRALYHTVQVALVFYSVTQ